MPVARMLVNLLKLKILMLKSNRTQVGEKETYSPEQEEGGKYSPEQEEGGTYSPKQEEKETYSPHSKNEGMKHIPTQYDSHTFSFHTMGMKEAFILL